MNPDEYARYDGLGLAELVRGKQVTAQELADLALAGIERVDPQLNGIIETFPDRARIKELPDGPFRGVPMVNKDLSFPERGIAMEMGSELARGFVAQEDSAVFARLRAAGLVNLGRATTPEFGLAGVTETLIAGVTKNPWNLTRTPGGSSGRTWKRPPGRSGPCASPIRTSPGAAPSRRPSRRPRPRPSRPSRRPDTASRRPGPSSTSRPS